MVGSQLAKVVCVWHDLAQTLRFVERLPNMNAIVKIQLNDLKNILATQAINLEYDESAVNYLGDKGYDPAFGARPLKRIIQKEVQNSLAKKILSGSYISGDKIKLSCVDGKLDI